MIRINLLPVRETRRAAGLRNQAIMLGVAVGLGALLCIAMHLSVGSRIATHRRVIAQKNSELASLDDTRKQVEKFEKERLEIEQKLNVIAELEKARSGPVRLMHELATRVPKRLWLTELNAKEGKLQLAGRSMDAEIVATFLTSLEESDLFHDVALEEATLKEEEGLKLSVFKIRGRYPFVERPEAESKKPTRRRSH